jgi:acetolactate synthase-1/2/3 large subunit
LQTNLHELATIRHHQLNTKLFVVNNDGYVSIRNTQNNFFSGHLAGTSRGSGVSFPNLEKLAAAFDIPYLRAETSLELREVVQKAMSLDGPVICEIYTAAEQEILPTVTSARRDDGSMESKPLHDMYPFIDAHQLKLELE